MSSIKFASRTVIISVLFFIYLAIGLPLTILWFYEVSGSTFDLDSSDSLLYNDVAQHFKERGVEAIQSYSNEGYGLSDLGALALPTLSYLLVGHWWLSRVFNIFLIASCYWSDVKYGSKKLFLVILFYANPLILYYCGSGLKEILFIVLILKVLKRSKSRKMVYILYSTFLELFRSLFGVIFIFERFAEKRFLRVGIVIAPILYLILPANYKYLLYYVISNPEFLFSKVPIMSLFAIITGPIPLISSFHNPYYHLVGLGLAFYSMMILNYIFKRDKMYISLVLLLIAMLILSGTLWKARYWIPVYAIVYSSLYFSEVRLRSIYLFVPFILFFLSFLYV